MKIEGAVTTMIYEYPFNCVLSHQNYDHVGSHMLLIYSFYNYVLMYVPWAGNSVMMKLNSLEYQWMEKPCKLVHQVQYCNGIPAFLRLFNLHQNKEHVGSDMCIILIGPHTIVNNIMTVMRILLKFDDHMQQKWFIFACLLLGCLFVLFYTWFLVRGRGLACQ